MPSRAHWSAAGAVLALAALFLVLKPTAREPRQASTSAAEHKRVSASSDASRAEPPPEQAAGDSAAGRRPAPAAVTPAQPGVVAASGPNTPPSDFQPVGSPSSGADAIQFDFAVANNRVTTAPKTLRVQRGQTVRIRIVADRKDTLHVHGYDHKLQLKPGQHSELSFDAGTAGRFGLELHHPELELGALEVFP